MAIKTRELKGTVVSHFARFVAQKKKYSTEFSTVLLEGYLSGMVQVWVNEDSSLVFVQCPLNEVRLILRDKREPTLKEIAEIVTATSNLYPTGTELSLVWKEFTRHNGSTGDVYEIKPAPVNRLLPKKKGRREHEVLPGNDNAVEFVAEAPAEAPGHVS